MDIKTKSMGVVCIDDKPKITIPAGLFGFEDQQNYALLNSSYNSFMWLQSIQKETLAFLVVDPFEFFTNYEIDVDQETIDDLDITSPSDVMILVIVTIPGRNKPITANLQGPLVINKKNKKAKQIILDDPQWNTKHNLNDAVVNRGK